MYEDILEKYKEQLIKINDARIQALTGGGVVEFSIDTSQSTQKVKRYELSDLVDLEKHIENQIAKIERKINGNIVYLRTL